MGKALMVQGTASYVGKSVLAAGLCRLFADEGLRVAPFKAQNMALNSFATPDGREIGRAQAAQAEAARIPPTVDMNPILLKPEGQARSQVVVAGRVWGTLDAAEFQRRKAELWPIVEASLMRLLASFDLVVIEGAGSPVEVNLKDGDIVNMRVARAAQAPVVLVADIDRGGVFASLVGTMELLEPAERDLVAGFVINKFRGDPELFRPGVTFLEERLHRPVLGVVPWIDDLDIAQEDSQGLPEHPSEQGPAWLDVVVVRLPHIANFDDFDPLARRPGVRFRYVSLPAALGRPDLVILPGTKATRADLRWLSEAGLGEGIQAHARSGGAVIGICGGYQMLGERIEDASGVEGRPGSTPGLGVLPAVTHFERGKTTVQVQGKALSGKGLLAAAGDYPVSAYEIHMGRTRGRGRPVFSVAGPDGRTRKDGLASEDGWTLGTYLHGLFGNEELLEALLAALARRKGVALPPPVPHQDAYGRLAGVLRQCLDVPRLRQLIGLVA